MLGFLKTAFNVVKGAVKGVKTIVSAVKEQKANNALKANTAAVTAAAITSNASAPEVPAIVAFKPLPTQVLASAGREYAEPGFNSERTMENVAVRADKKAVRYVAPSAAAAPSPGKNPLVMVLGILALVAVLIVAIVKKK